MPLPATWLPFIHPMPLRANLGWASQFGKNRRSYIIGYGDAAIAVGRPVVDTIKVGLSAAFKEDPRRYIPLQGWRDLLYPTGEPIAAPCSRWGQFGRDQPEYAWLMRPMRLFDALKALAALYDAQDQNPRTAAPIPTPNGAGPHAPGEISIHPAIYTVQGFDDTYYNTYFANDAGRRQRFATFAGLFLVYNGVEFPTLYELSESLCVTYRTAEGLINFAAVEGIPPIGPAILARSARGANRTHRAAVKNKRNGYLEEFSADCAIEAFIG